MRRCLKTAREDETAQAAAQRMREDDLGFLPVCDADGIAVGVVTDRDLALRVCADDRRSAETLVRDVMTPGVVACRAGHTLVHAQGLMEKHRKSRVLVTDEHGRPVGVLSVTDLVAYATPGRFARTMSALAERRFRPESP